MFDLHEKTSETLSKFNDSVTGRCSICLENFRSGEFSENQELLQGEKFSDRLDLVRIDDCFHRFHLVCLYRDWFMQRAIEKDEFGGLIITEIPEIKRCPICRRSVEESEEELIKKLYCEHPEFEDNGYK